MTGKPTRMLSGCLDTSIGEMIRSYPDLISGFSYVLVTSLDSTHDVSSADIGREIMQRFPRCTAVGDGILIPAAEIAKVDREIGLFFGFDEIWCLDVALNKPKPGNISILPPPSLDSTVVESTVEEWMMASACRLGLGDGFGLNYVTSDAEVSLALGEIAQRMTNGM